MKIWTAVVEIEDFFGLSKPEIKELFYGLADDPQIKYTLKDLYVTGSKEGTS